VRRVRNIAGDRRDGCAKFAQGSGFRFQRVPAARINDQRKTPPGKKARQRAPSATRRVRCGFDGFIGSTSLFLISLPTSACRDQGNGSVDQEHRAWDHYRPVLQFRNSAGDRHN
jgi:hypothetical protein